MVWFGTLFVPVRSSLGLDNCGVYLPAAREMRRGVGRRHDSTLPSLAPRPLDPKREGKPRFRCRRWQGQAPSLLPAPLANQPSRSLIIRQPLLLSGVTGGGPRSLACMATSDDEANHFSSQAMNGYLLSTEGQQKRRGVRVREEGGPPVPPRLPR